MIGSPNEADRSWALVARAYFMQEGIWNTHAVTSWGQVNPEQSLGFHVGPQYDGGSVHLRITRQGPLINLLYSADGTTWNPARDPFSMPLPEEVILCLGANAGDDAPLAVEFTDFHLTTGERLQPPPPTRTPVPTATPTPVPAHLAIPFERFSHFDGQAISSKFPIRKR